MTSLVALVSGSGWHVADLQRAAATIGVSLHTVPFPRVTATVGLDRNKRDTHARVAAGGLDLSRADGVLVRMMPPGSLEQVVFRMDVLHRLKDIGVPVLNPPRAVEASVDKYLTLALLEAAKIPVPPTWVGESAADALTAFEMMGGDAVVKPLFGSEGRGLVRVSDREIAWRTFHAIERLAAVLYVQRIVRNPGHDLRVFVLDGSVLASMRRHAAVGDWRTNISLGGRAESCRIDTDVERLALHAAAAVGAVMAGVDLLMDLDRGEYVVLEVNAVPGWRALARVTGIDVAAAILTTLKNSRR